MIRNRKDKIISREDKQLIQETLKENEVRANRLCCGIFTVVAVMFLIAGILNTIGVFKMKDHIVFAIILGIVMLMAPTILNRSGKISSEKSKWILLISLCATMLITDAVNNYNVALAIALPILLAAMYFEVRTVVITSVATVVSFGIETYLSAIKRIHIDNNHVTLDDGTVLVVRDGLKNTLRAIIDPEQYAIAVMVRGYLPRIMMLWAFIAMAIAIASYGRTMLIRQAKVAAEQTRISTELELANRLQANALPDPKDINGKYDFEIAASMTAARETGGDFYDFTMLDDDHLAIVIADVSDKGVPAAMFMMSAKSTLSDSFNIGRSPSRIISEANSKLCSRNKEEMFVTVWFGIYEISTGTLISTNAGHEDPIRYSAGSYQELNEKHDTLMGVFEDIKYEDNVTELKPGDVMFLYTDGVSEACNQEGKMYGTQRLLECMNRDCKDHDLTASGIMNAVKHDIERFTGEAEQFDDLTMVVLKV